MPTHKWRSMGGMQRTPTNNVVRTNQQSTDIVKVPVNVSGPLTIKSTHPNIDEYREGNGQVRVQDGTSKKTVEMAVTSGGTGIIQVHETDVAAVIGSNPGAKVLSLQPIHGLCGVGTTAPQTTLHVQGSTYISHSGDNINNNKMDPTDITDSGDLAWEGETWAKGLRTKHWIISDNEWDDKPPGFEDCTFTEGYVGIGTMTPQSILHVSDPSNCYLILQGDSSGNVNGNYHPYLIFQQDGSNNEAGMYLDSDNNFNISASNAAGGNINFRTGTESSSNDSFPNIGNLTDADKQMTISRQGNVTIYNDLYVDGHTYKKGNTDISGDLVVDGTLDVSGHALFESDVSMNSNLYVQENLYVRQNLYVQGDTYKKEDTDISGSLFIFGELDVSGNTNLDGILDVSGNTLLEGTVNVLEYAFFQDDVSMNSNLDVSGNISIPKYSQIKLNCNGDLTDGSNGLNIYGGTIGLSSINGNSMRIQCENPAANNVMTLVSGTNGSSVDSSRNVIRMQVGGGNDTNQFSTFDISGLILGSQTESSSSDTGALRVSGGAGISKQLYVGDILDVGGNAIFQSDVSMNQNLFVGGDVSMNQNLYVQGTAIFQDDVSMNQLLKVNNLTVTGNTSLSTATAPTLGNDVSNNQIATTGFVGGAIAKLLGVAPTQLDTLAEIAQALDNSANFHEIVLYKTGFPDQTLDGSLNITGNLNVDGDVSMNNLVVHGDVSMNQNLFVQQNLDVDGTSNVQGYAIFQSDVSMNQNLFVGGDVSMNSNLNVDGTFHAGTIELLDTWVQGELVVEDIALFKSDVSMNSNLFVDGDVSCNGITSLSAATAQTPDATDDSTSIATTAWVQHFSTQGGGTGWLYDTDTDPNTLTTSSATTQVGIGTNSPGAALDVSGNMLLHNGTNMFLGSTNTNTTSSGGHNIGIGTDALLTNTTGTYNIALGFEALASNLGAGYNTAIGSGALAFNQTGTYNTAIGHGASNAPTALNWTTTIGSNALAEADHQIVLGTAAETVVIPGHLDVNGNALFQSDVSMNSNLDISGNLLLHNGYNMYIGTDNSGNGGSVGDSTTGAISSGDSGSGGGGNTGIGIDALKSNSTGSWNVAVGYQSLMMSNSSNNGNNTAVGYRSLELCTSGEKNVAVGTSALQDLETGSWNTAIGWRAGYTGASNTNSQISIGYNANNNYADTDGAVAPNECSIAIGNNSSSAGSNSTAIGFGASVSHDNSTAIGAGASSTAANQITLGSEAFKQDLYTFGDTYRVIYDDHDISHNILLKPWIITDNGGIQDCCYMEGNVGIGTTTPQSTLDVSGNVFVSGNVGIGTNNPSDKLHINVNEADSRWNTYDPNYAGANSDGSVNVNYQSQNGICFFGLGQSTAPNPVPDVEWTDYTTNPIGENLSVTSANYNATIVNYNRYTPCIQYDGNLPGGIRDMHIGILSSDDDGGKLSSSGNGTNPYGYSNALGWATGAGGKSDPDIVMVLGNGGDLRLNSTAYIKRGMAIGLDYNNCVIHSTTDYSQGVGADAIILPENGLIVQGNVGIGTTTPSAKLEVNGNILCSGNLDVIGTATAPTLGNDVSNNQIATTGFVGGAIDNLIDNAPGALNTLNEIAAAIADKDNFYNIVLYNTGVSDQTLDGSLNITGRVGIGTITPQSTLDVSGNIVCSGYGSFTGFDGNNPNLTQVPGVHLGTYVDGTKKYGNIQIASTADSDGGWIDWVDDTGGNSDYNGRIRYDINKGMEFYTANAQQMVISPNSGNVGIGTTNPSANLHVKNDVSGAIIQRWDCGGRVMDLINPATADGNTPFIFSTGNAYQFKTDNRVSLDINASGNVAIQKAVSNNSRSLDVSGNVNITGVCEATSFIATSDARHKENICDLDRALEKICSIRGVNFNFKDDGNNGDNGDDSVSQTHAGILAQEVDEIIPEAICKKDDDKWAVNYNTFIGYLIESVKTLKSEIDEYKKDKEEQNIKIEKQQTRIEALESKMEALLALP